MEKQIFVLLGMSGGVDSSVAALLLKKQGYKVIGAFFSLYSDTKNPLTGECSYLEDLKMAKKIATLLKIPLIELDYEKQYKKDVLAPMFKAYKQGLTPNPDISCNSIIKFPYLWKEAKKLKSDYIATGHYARIKKTLGGFQLLSGLDSKKDQTYFLSSLTQEDLKHTLFPLGNLTKEKTRQIAKSNNFPNWNRHGTVGICFVGKTNMQSFLKKKIKNKTGKVINPSGDTIGKHQGISFYTIGQKANSNMGINIIKSKGFEQKRFYIAEKRKPNTLLVAPEGHSSLTRKEITIKKLHLINSNFSIPKELKARIRHLGSFHKGKLIKKSSKYHFIFNKPVEAIAPGQFIVLYKNNQVIGSGEMQIR